MTHNRFKNLNTLFFALAHGLRRGVACRSVSPPQKILIIQLAKLGDMVCTTPMFRAVKKKYPQAQLWVLGNSINQELVAGNPDIDHYIPFSKYGVADATEMNRLAQLVRREQFDFACMTSPQFELLALLYRAGVPCIAAPRIEGGWSPYETRPFKLLRRLVIAVPHRMGAYAPREYLRLLEPINIIESDTTKHLAFSAAANEAVDRFWRENGLQSADMVVGVAPSVGNKIKTWGAEKFAAVIAHLQQKPGTKVVIIGTAADRTEVAAVLSRLSSNSSLINACEQFSLDELKAAIARLSLFISVDTGPIYIAEAYRVPTIDILGPMDEREQPPCGGHHRVVFAPRTRAELHIMNSRVFNQVEARRQADTIFPEMVIRAIDELYLEIRPK